MLEFELYVGAALLERVTELRRDMFSVADEPTLFLIEPVVPGRDTDVDGLEEFTLAPLFLLIVEGLVETLPDVFDTLFLREIVDAYPGRPVVTLFLPIVPLPPIVPRCPAVNLPPSFICGRLTGQ